jgi:hypothetical protein
MPSIQMVTVVLQKAAEVLLQKTPSGLLIQAMRQLKQIRVKAQFVRTKSLPHFWDKTYFFFFYKRPLLNEF